MRRWTRIVVVSMLIAGCRGRHEEPGTPAPTRLPPPAVAARAAQRAEAAGKQILFGDLHVHTTFSADAFIRSLPVLQGEGAHPPADACDFARFCSGLDFWSINDHAESISPQHWRETKESVRQCNAVAGDPRSPDLVTYLGWEWTQVGVGPADHYGHKNVIFRDTAEDRVPRRPISALDQRLIGALRQRPPLWQRLRFPLLDFKNRQRYFDFGTFQNELAAVPLCPAGDPVRPPPPRADLPCAWQAGDLVRARSDGAPPAECERRVAAARNTPLRAGAAGRMTLPDEPAESWKDCGQCRDCFDPAFNYRPRSSVQYAMAITNFDDPAHPRRFRFGFIASSDNHTARPGTGYKEYARRMMTEAAGVRDEAWRDRGLGGPPAKSAVESAPFDPAGRGEGAATTLELHAFERAAACFMTGGLVGVHATGRDRDAIWNALKRREVYGTSGPRILLWFDLLAPDGALTMGSETRLDVAPRFRVRAVGSLAQKPGCPDWSARALGPQRLDYLCRG